MTKNILILFAFVLMEAYRNNANTVEVRVYDNVNDVGSDDVLGDNGTSIIEIRVYP